MSAGGTWLELSVTADNEAVEQVSEILSRACPGGVSVEAPFDLVDEGLGAIVRKEATAVVRGYVPASDARLAASAVEGVRRALGHLQAFELRPIGELETRVVHEEDWAHAWRETFQVQRVGRRLVIQPSWREYQPQRSDVVLKLDPGMAFGTGLHPTTRLCLAGLEDWSALGLVAGAEVIDVGTGSGILAICAAALGASSVVAIDTDPMAVGTAARNAELNGFGGVIRTRTGSVPLSPVRDFPLVVANLVAGLLVELAPALSQATRPGGRLLVSGVFHDRGMDVVAALESAALEVMGRRAEGDWLAIECSRAR